MRKIRVAPPPWIILIPIIFGLSLVACAQTSGRAASRLETLSGVVVAGPTCPGPATVPERPGCADQPVSSLPIQITLPDDQVVTTTTTDQEGHFTVRLPAGSYLVTARFGRRGLQSTPVKVAMGKITTVQITLDTGIR